MEVIEEKLADSLRNLLSFWLAFTSSQDWFRDSTLTLQASAQNAQQVLNIGGDSSAIDTAISNLNTFPNDGSYFATVAASYPNFTTAAGKLVIAPGQQVDPRAVARLWLLVTTRPDLFAYNPDQANAISTLDEAITPFIADATISDADRQAAVASVYGFSINIFKARVRSDFHYSTLNSWPAAVSVGGHPDVADLSSF
jgi:hypothetical protein